MEVIVSSSLRIAGKGLRVFLIGLALFGCAGKQLGEIYQKVDSVPADKTLINIYRIYTFPGASYDVTIMANGREIAALPVQAYYSLLADPGETEVSTKILLGRGDSVTVDGKAGQTYYLEVGIVGGTVGQAAIVKVQKDRGELKLLNSRKALPKTSE
jgi:hypothetical protein